MTSEQYEMIIALEVEASRFEAVGVDQYQRSANDKTEIGYTDFNNARIWGQRAQDFRRAANFLREKFDD